ncbi:MAG: DNA polymerase III subunit delta [Longimicrobiales bacterium]
MNPLDDIGLSQARGGVFYFHGDDDFRKEEALRALVDLHLDPATKDFNLDWLRGGDVDGEQLASVIATPPMMAEWRVVVVREVEGLASSPKTRQVLLDAADAPPPGLALILSCTPPAKSKARFYKDLGRAAQSVEFRPVDAADVPGWLMERAQQRYQLDLEPAAAQALGSAIGANLGVLTMELDKLADFIQSDTRTVTLADVQAAGTSLPAQDRWQWFDLVAERRFVEAMDGLPTLMDQGESAVALIIGLATQFLRLGVIAEKGKAALEPTLPPHQRWLAGKLARQAPKWRPVEIDAALEGLLRADGLAKSSPVGDQHLVEEWLLVLQAREMAA